MSALDDSISMYSRSLELTPDNAYSFNGLGAAYQTKARYLLSLNKDANSDLEAASENYEKSIQLNNKIVTSYSGVAEVYY